MLYACGWQEPDSIPSNVVLKKQQQDMKKSQNEGGCAGCYCGAYYPVDGAYDADYSSAFDYGADSGACGGKR